MRWGVSERILFSVYINPNHFVSLYCFPPSPPSGLEYPEASARCRQLATMSHSTPATYLVWTLLTSLVRSPPLSWK